jgi:alpha-L-fucosidase
MRLNDTWRCTRKLGKLYIHLFEWPQGIFTIEQVDVNLKNACLLADPAKKPLPSTYQHDRLSITLPQNAPDAIASVLVLEIGGEATQKLSSHP